DWIIRDLASAFSRIYRTEELLPLCEDPFEPDDGAPSKASECDSDELPFVPLPPLPLSQKRNSSLNANTGERGPLPSLRTGSCSVRSQRCTVLTPRSSSAAISFQLCSTSRDT